MATHLVTAESTDAEVLRAYESNAEPFSSLDQVERFIRAASLTRERFPSLSEHAGVRTELRDPQSALDRAIRWKNGYLRGRRGSHRQACVGGFE